MGVRVECDWCRQPIEPGEPYVTVEIDGQMRQGAPGNKHKSASQPARVYCGADRYEDGDPAARGLGYGNHQWGHRESCAKRMLAALDGNPAGRADCGLEWKLVAQVAPRPDYLVDAPVDALTLSGRTIAALQKAGVATVRELAVMTEAQWLAIKGIGRSGGKEILEALHRHTKVDPKALVGEGAPS